MYFAGLEHLTVSNYTRSALARRAAGAIKDTFTRYEEKRQTISLLVNALKNGSWEALAASEPEVYPASKKEWEQQIATHEATSATVLGVLWEMEPYVVALEIQQDQQTATAMTVIKTLS